MLKVSVHSTKLDAFSKINQTCF